MPGSAGKLGILGSLAYGLGFMAATELGDNQT